MSERVDIRQWILKYRAIVVAAIHIGLTAAAYYAAFSLRLDTARPWTEPYGRLFLTGLPLVLGARLVAFLPFDLFRGMWRYVSTSDLIRIFLAVSLGSLLYVPLWIFWLAGDVPYPGSMLVLDWAFCIFFLGGSRFAIRAFREFFVPMKKGGRRVVIIGAGDSGEMLLREMKTHQHLSYHPVGFVDDDPGKKGRKIHGVKVLGPIEDLARIVDRDHVDEVIVSITSATGKQMERILQICRPLSVKLRRIPTEGDIVRLTQIRDVLIEDLLERPAVRLDQEKIEAALHGRRVLITGAGGSIGSELVRQIAVYGPERICVLDWNENALFFLERELLDHYPGLEFDLLICDIQDERRVREVFREGGFQHVYHAAAFKHVPLMEANPLEAVKNNLGGTRVLANAAREAGVEKFVLISSDKAVRPTSVMGATKRAAELLLSSIPSDGTQFVSVRFGNVLGSRGSVVPLFKKQIREGGPVTVTDPDVIRYFMTIPEAVQLVLQAGVMGAGGEVFLLDMGEPVKIIDLARKLIRLSGFEPDRDIPIRFVGLRPGEKLYEELLVEAEGAHRTEHRKIWILNGGSTPPPGIGGGVDDLLGAAVRGDVEEAIRGLKGLVPEYRPQNEAFSRVLREEMPEGTAG